MSEILFITEASDTDEDFDVSDLTSALEANQLGCSTCGESESCDGTTCVKFSNLGEEYAPIDPKDLFQQMLANGEEVEYDGNGNPITPTSEPIIGGDKNFAVPEFTPFDQNEISPLPETEDQDDENSFDAHKNFEDELSQLEADGAASIYRDSGTIITDENGNFKDVNFGRGPLFENWVDGAGDREEQMAAILEAIKEGRSSIYTHDEEGNLTAIEYYTFHNGILNYYSALFQKPEIKRDEPDKDEAKKEVQPAEPHTPNPEGGSVNGESESSPSKLQSTETGEQGEEAHNIEDAENDAYGDPTIESSVTAKAIMTEQDTAETLAQEQTEEHATPDTHTEGSLYTDLTELMGITGITLEGSTGNISSTTSHGSRQSAEGRTASFLRFENSTEIVDEATLPTHDNNPVPSPFSRPDMGPGNNRQMDFDPGIRLVDSTDEVFESVILPPDMGSPIDQPHTNEGQNTDSETEATPYEKFTGEFSDIYEAGLDIETTTTVHKEETEQTELVEEEKVVAEQTDLDTAPTPTSPEFTIDLDSNTDGQNERDMDRVMDAHTDGIESEPGTSKTPNNDPGVPQPPAAGPKPSLPVKTREAQTLDTPNELLHTNVTNEGPLTPLEFAGIQNISPEELVQVLGSKHATEEQPGIRFNQHTSRHINAELEALQGLRKSVPSATAFEPDDTVETVALNLIRGLPRAASKATTKINA